MNKLEEIRNKLKQLTTKFATKKDLDTYQAALLELEKTLSLLTSLTEEKQKQVLFDIEAKLKEIEIFINSLTETKIKEFEKSLQIKLLKIKKEFEEVVKKFEEEIEKIKKESKKFQTFMIGPSASGIEVQLEGNKEGVFSVLNFIQGNNINITKTIEPQKGKINLIFSASNNHNLLDGKVHSDTDTTIVERGMLIVGKVIDGEVKWSGLPIGPNNFVLKSDGLDVFWGTFNWVDINDKPSDLVTGTGMPGQISFFMASNVIAGDDSLFWNNTDKCLGIGTTTPTARLSIVGKTSDSSTNALIISNAAGTGLMAVRNDNKTFIGGTGPVDNYAPTNVLEVRGSLVVDGNCYARTTSGGTRCIYLGISGSVATLGVIGGAAVSEELRIQPYVAANPGFITFYNANTGPGSREVMRIISGNVGIRTTSPNSVLHVAGSLALPITTITSTTTLNETHYTILADATSGVITINLPTASGIAGRIYIIKKIDSTTNAVIIDPYGSETIDGATTYSLTSQNQVVRIQSDGTNWRII